MHGERDTELQVGLTVPYKGWVLDMDWFHTLSHNFLDHGNINYDLDGMQIPTNIYLPLTTQEAVIRGFEVTLKSPELLRRIQIHSAYSNQSALFTGAITGGLNNFAVQEGWAPLDHDQKDTLNVGFEVRLPWQSVGCRKRVLRLGIRQRRRQRSGLCDAGTRASTISSRPHHGGPIGEQIVWRAVLCGGARSQRGQQPLAD